jgi:hypothetical protein
MIFIYKIYFNNIGYKIAHKKKYNICNYKKIKYFHYFDYKI